MIKIFVCLSDHYNTHQSEEHWRRLADDMHHGKTINEEDIKYVAARDHLSQSEARQKLQDNRDKENAEENAKGTVHK
jgi:NACalpha-BTF3-like transcription factor